MTKGIIGLDADGVLLHYNLAYASAWERAFRAYLMTRTGRLIAGRRVPK